jgi:ABC-2 type transport system ATP-binding protein
VLFLDEPTAGLDPAAARQVTELIRQLSHQEGRTTFLCTHNLAEAQRLCDRVGVIDRGKLRATGTPAQLARELWTGIWVEVELREEPSPAVLAALAGLPQVQSHSQSDGVVTAELNSEEAIPCLVEALSLAGGRIYRVSPQEHSLEEIYFQIQAQDLGGDTESGS